MKNVLFLFLMFAVLSCGRAADGCTDADLRASRAAGQRDAAVVLAADSASFERDRAVFAIRARETRLREAGFGVAADVYVEAAAGVLRSEGLID